MTLQRPLKKVVGVRELHNELSRYVGYVATGGEVTVTTRGKPVARLVPVDRSDPLDELRSRGLVAEPTAEWSPRDRSRRPSATASDLVAEQRR